MVKRKYSRLTASLATFAVSALWHGFYPGYYFSFISLALIDAVVKYIEVFTRGHVVKYDENGNEIPLPAKKYYDAVFIVTINCMFFYFANPFKMYTFENVMKSWGSIYFFWHVFGLVAVVFLTLFGKYIPRGNRRPGRQSKGIKGSSSFLKDISKQKK